MRPDRLQPNSCNIHGLRHLKPSSAPDEVTTNFTSDTFSTRHVDPVCFYSNLNVIDAIFFSHLRTKLCAFVTFARINIMCIFLSHPHCRVRRKFVITLETCTITEYSCSIRMNRWSAPQRHIPLAWISVWLRVHPDLLSCAFFSGQRVLLF